MKNNYPLPIITTNYTIDINGDIINTRTGTLLKSTYTKKEGQRNTRIYYKFHEKRKLRKRKRGTHWEVWNQSKTISNSRYMLNSYFTFDFHYKIFYKDGDKSNTRIDNLIVRQNKTFNEIDGKHLLTLIEQCYRINEDGSLYYQKPIIKDV